MGFCNISIKYFSLQLLNYLFLNKFFILNHLHLLLPLVMSQILCTTPNNVPSISQPKGIEADEDAIN